jgi:ribonuclease-3
MGIDQQVTKNPCQNGAVSKTAMASTLEAVMGAAWLDSGKDWPVTRAIATRLYCK